MTSAVLNFWKNPQVEATFAPHLAIHPKLTEYIERIHAESIENNKPVNLPVEEEKKSASESYAAELILRCQNELLQNALSDEQHSHKKETADLRE